MDPKIGAFWKPEKKSDRGPIGKGNLDFSRLSADEMNIVRSAIASGNKIKCTLWFQRDKREDKWPDFQVTLDQPYNGRVEANRDPPTKEERAESRKMALEGVGTMRHDKAIEFDDSIPF